MDKSSALPVLLIAFNRPDLTRNALKKLEEIKPSILLFSIDGPRENCQEDLVKVNSCRKLVEEVTWQCELFTNFSDKNYGSGIWPYKSINWAFEHVQKLLILEDDVSISKDFYKESMKLSNHFKSDNRIFSICASNISDLKAKEKSNELFFSKYFSGWGWVTWKDRWECYRYDLKSEPSLGFLKLLYMNKGNIFISLYFFINFYLVKRDKIQAWDYQVNYLLFTTERIVVKFKKNLSSNLGLGIDATHTKYLPIIRSNCINGPYELKDNPVLTPKEERLWRKSRTRFILKSWLLRALAIEKNTTY
jgi:hypothetical protein